VARAELTGSYSVASAAKESLKVWLQLSQVRHMYSTVKSSLHMQDYQSMQQVQSAMTKPVGQQQKPDPIIRKAATFPLPA